MNAIEVNNISKSYGRVKALEDVSFAVEKGEVFGLIGPDGAGKTSMFRILCTLLLADVGTASVDGFDVVRQMTDIRKSYPLGDDSLEVLHGISMEIADGTVNALVGPSGSGKSTIARLIASLWDVDSGVIEIGGVNIKEMPLAEHNKHIAYVSQENYLFDQTVMDNIRMGRAGATDDEVVEAAKTCGCHDFIMSLPDGYHTDIGQRGVKLSGGQKQRISIARVFLKNPPILIFDEATSSLDNKSEKVVQKSLEALAQNRTTLVIAHRLSTIRAASRILVLSEDGIDEEGTHEELMEKNGVYAMLYRLQFPEFLEETDDIEYAHAN